MGRYRAPQTPGSPYITPEGHATLARELDYLWREKRPEVTRKVSEAAAQGDRSENADYIYGKKQLYEIDRRVRFLRKRLEALTIVHQTPDDTQRAYFGAWVRLEDSEGNTHEYRIVGPDEFEPQKGWISMDSPLAKTLLRKTIDDTFTVELPRGSESYTVLDIQYCPFSTPR